MDKHFGILLNDAFKLAARMLHDRADAHDVIQDAAAIAISHESAPNMQSEDFRPWFYRVVRNKSIDKLRSQRRENARTETSDISIESVESSRPSNPEELVAINQAKNKLEIALGRISVAHREVILLKDVHGFSYADIANILNIANGSVMSRIHRARLALKEEIELTKNEEHSHVE